MNIIQVHNYYRNPGGEDQVLLIEKDLLVHKGHCVTQLIKHNKDIDQMSNISVAKLSVWNRGCYHDLERLFLRATPDICHVHNTFPLISPSVYYACKKNNVPVIQTLHNFRLSCPNAFFFRDGHLCEDCVGSFFPWPGVWHGCYRNSRSASGVVAIMLALHRLLKTWQKQVDMFIVLTEFGKQKFIQGGLPEEKILVSPNIVEQDPGQKQCLGDYAIFVGRLSPEKGLKTLLAAWGRLPGIPLRIVGDGPLMSELQSIVIKKGLGQVKLLGKKPNDETINLMKTARLLIFPSECYEGFPVTIAEAYACGLPVIASNLGAMSELIINENTGLLFEPGSPQDLAVKVLSCWCDFAMLKRLGAAARAAYETKYTKIQKYDSLIQIYERAIDGHKSR